MGKRNFVLYATQNIFWIIVAQFLIQWKPPILFQCMYIYPEHSCLFPEK